MIGISELADSSVTLSIQPWVAVADMVGARAELYQAIVERFRASKIDIPFPVREVRLIGAPRAERNRQPCSWKGKAVVCAPSPQRGKIQSEVVSLRSNWTNKATLRSQFDCLVEC